MRCWILALQSSVSIRRGTSSMCMEPRVSFLGELNIWNDPQSQLLAEWNWRLWACIADEPNQALQIKLIDPQDGYTGVVAWSNQQPSVLEVALTSLDRIGLKFDLAWSQLIFGGVLDRYHD